MSENYNEIFIIDLGLCKPINDLQDSDNKIKEIYGVLPYMAPETLRQKPYTSASDIYSFSMVMWEFTSGIPPFNRVAHDHHLILSVCGGKRPEIVENTPKCYIDLMKKCWDSDPSNRPTITMLEDIISEWIRCINEYCRINRDGNYNYEVSNVDNKLKVDMFEFIKANKTLVQDQASASIIHLIHKHIIQVVNLLKSYFKKSPIALNVWLKFNNSVIYSLFVVLFVSHYISIFTIK
ncbi:unnamed protein product [Rhizophagus irregularis]|nr:unnamed protein product [Rhizophagus irregularis]